MSTDTEGYATSVVGVLREHFPDLADSDVAEVTYHAINDQLRNPRDSFEFIVDDPRSARWRLKSDSGDRRRVRLAYYPVIPPGSHAGNALEQIVNEALRILPVEE